MTEPIAIAHPRRVAAELVGLSEKELQKAVAEGDLIAHYRGTKPLFLVSELERWVASLPTEPKRRSA